MIYISNREYTSGINESRIRHSYWPFNDTVTREKVDVYEPLGFSSGTTAWWACNGHLLQDGGWRRDDG